MSYNPFAKQIQCKSKKFNGNEGAKKNVMKKWKFLRKADFIS